MDDRRCSVIGPSEGYRSLLDAFWAGSVESQMRQLRKAPSSSRMSVNNSPDMPLLRDYCPDVSLGWNPVG